MVERNAADGNFKVSFPERPMEFTGERMTTAIDGQIEFEHFHRYCFARDLCEDSTSSMSAPAKVTVP